MIDFGLSKKYKDTKSGQHIVFEKDETVAGTARYASINMHMKNSASRKDDLESLGYMLMYFLRGDLPWQGIEGTPDEIFNKIKDKKIGIPIEILCGGFASIY